MLLNGRLRPKFATEIAMARNTTGVKGLYLKHGLYVYQGPMVAGRRPAPVHLGTGDFAAAVAEVELIKTAKFVRDRTAPMAELIEAFLEAKTRQGEHRGAITTRTAKPGLDRFAAYFRRPADQITTEQLREWKAAMIGEGLSGATIAGYMRYSQSLMSWLVREGKIRKNPFVGQKGLFPKSIPTKREAACTKAQRDQLIKGCDYLPLKAVLFIGFHTGLRRNEILNLRPDWIVRSEAGRPVYIHVQNIRGDGAGEDFTIKDAGAKRVPISRPLADFLEHEYGLDHSPYLIRPDLPARDTTDYRWEWKRRWKTYMKSQCLPWVGAHTMRHTWFSLLLSAPSDKRPSPLQLERWSGTDWNTIRKNYAHLFDDGEAINAAN